MTDPRTIPDRDTDSKSESDTQDSPGSKTANTPSSGAADAAQLRDEIDRGGAGDKVAFSDPSAAPLGTDDEAAGTPPSRGQVSEAAKHETRREEPKPGKPTAQELQGPEHGKLMKSLPQPVIWVIVGIGVVIVIGWLLSGGS
ncbi:MAG: hypothetical protein ABNH26_07605 [Celeribacter sp.]|jgi:hypothetical protein